MRVLSIILLGIFIYLLIGVFVTFSFLERQHSLNEGAAGVLIIGPVIWPCLAVSMAHSAVEDKQREQRAAVAAREYYIERMAACPAGFEPSCDVYYSRRNSAAGITTSYSREEAFVNFTQQLELGNLPEEPEQRLEMVKILASITPGGLETNLEALEPLFAPELPSSAGYAAAFALQDSLGYKLGWTDEKLPDAPEQLAIQTRALELIIKGHERYLAEHALPGHAPGMAKLYEANARRLKQGEEYEKALKKTVAAYTEMALGGTTRDEVYSGLMGVMKYNLDWPELEKLLQAVAASLEQGRKLERNFIRSRDLPEITNDNKITRDAYNLILEDFFPLLESTEQRVQALYYLLPIVGHNTFNLEFTPQADWRRLCYDLYLTDGNPAWLEVCWKACEKRPDMREHLTFVRAELAWINGQDAEAVKLLREYFSGENFSNLEQRRLFDINGLANWAASKRGRQLADLAFDISMDERAKRRSW